MIICSVFLIAANCAVFFLPVFYLIKNRTKAKKVEQSAPHKALAKPHSQIESEKLSLEGQIKLPLPQFTTDIVEVSEKGEVKSQENSARNEDSAICHESDLELKVGKVVFQAQKEKSIDNFSILQSSGSGSGSNTPRQMTPTSSPRLLSPFSASSRLIKPSIFSKEKTIEKGDFTQKTILQKKVGTKRISLKSFVTDELELKSVDSEKAVGEATRTEIEFVTPNGRTQEDVEFENLLNALKFDKITSKSNEETSEHV